MENSHCTCFFILPCSRDISKFWESPFSKPHAQKWQKLPLKGSGSSLSRDIFALKKDLNISGEFGETYEGI